VATVTTDPYHEVTMTALAWMDCVQVDPGDDDVFGWYHGTLYKLTGDSWGAVKDLTATYGSVSARDLYVSPAGDIYVSPSGSGVLVKMAAANYANTEVLTFACTGAAFWHMCEASDSLYVTEYGDCKAGGGPSIYRSTGGNTWLSTETWADYRHLHGVWATAAEGSLYVSLGDGAGDQGIWRSVNHGADWTELSSTLQPISFAYAPDGDRLWGTDTEATDNRILTTSNDSNFTAELTLTGTDNAFPWAMTRLSTGIVFAGTQAIGGGSNCHILRRDLAGNWYSVYAVGACDYWQGILGFSIATSGDVFYAVDNKSGCVWRIDDWPLYSVGATGCDYTTLALAIAGTAANDTLVVTESVTAQQIAPHAGMRIRTPEYGEKQIVWRNSTTLEAFTLDETDVSFNDLIFRASNASITRNAAIGMYAAATAEAAFRRCEFQALTTTANPGVLCITSREGTADGARLELRDCIIDSVRTANTSSGEYGVIYLQSITDIIVRDLIMTNCSSGRSNIFIYDEAAQDTVLFSNCLFAHNVSGDYGAALRHHSHTSTAYSMFDHITCYQNQTGDDNDGQMQFTGSATNRHLAHSVFVGDGSNTTYATSDGLGSILLYDVNHTCAFANGGSNAIAWYSGGGGSSADNLIVDPNLNTTPTGTATDIVESSDFLAKRKSVRVATDDDYMGWGLYVYLDGGVGRRRRH
jgi:hypothetical protein